MEIFPSSNKDQGATAKLKAKKLENISSTTRSAEQYRRMVFPEFKTEEAMLNFLEGKTIVDIGSGLNHKNPFALINEAAKDKRRNIKFLGFEPKLANSQNARFRPGQYAKAAINIVGNGLARAIDTREILHPINRPGRKNIIAASAEKLPLAPGSVDIVLSVYLIGYWITDEIELLKIIKEIESVLRPGGEIRLYEVKNEVEKLFEDPSNSLGKFMNEHFNIPKKPEVNLRYNPLVGPINEGTHSLIFKKNSSRV